MPLQHPLSAAWRAVPRKSWGECGKHADSMADELDRLRAIVRRFTPDTLDALAYSAESRAGAFSPNALVHFLDLRALVQLARAVVGER